MVLEFGFRGDASPILDYLPKPSENVKSLSRIITINCLFGIGEKCLRLNGPDGETYVFSRRTSYVNSPLYAVDGQILRSLDQSILSTTKRLTISRLKRPLLRFTKSQTFQTLSSVNSFHTLVLTRCYNLPFILPLNPNKNPSNLVVCPKLKDLVLCIQERNWFYLMDMLSMAEGRALRDTKLSSITIVGFGKLVLGKNAFKLREHVGRVDYGVNDVPPHWDDHPSESGDETE